MITSLVMQKSSMTLKATVFARKDHVYNVTSIANGALNTDFKSKLISIPMANASAIHECEFP